MAKIFDWEHEDFKKHNPKIQAFYRLIYKSGMTMETFIGEFEKLPRKKNNGRKSPSYLKAQYKNLKKKFNFFK